MLLNHGTLDGARVLARPSVETMTTDQLTPEQKAVSTMVPGYWDDHGWGFGMSVVTRRTDPAEGLGQYGWDGGFGTLWHNDPGEDMVAILLTQAAWTSPTLPPIASDFRTAVRAAIDD